MSELDVLHVPDRATWRRWLDAHHGGSPGVWFVFFKKGSGGASPSYEEAVREALCFGWIDSLVKRRDERSYLQRFTPRKPGGSWSSSNLARWEELVREGRVTPAGYDAGPPQDAAQVAAADDARRRSDTVPAWLSRALRRDAGVWAAFRALSPSQRRLTVRWISEAKREETRARRLRETAERLRAGEPLGPK